MKANILELMLIIVGVAVIAACTHTAEGMKEDTRTMKQNIHEATAPDKQSTSTVSQ